MVKRIQISNATESDLDAMVSLVRELADAVTDQRGLDIEVATENLAAMFKESRYHLLVARDEKSVVGFINFSVRRTILHAGSSGLIDELVVHCGVRGSGVGRVLIMAAAETCRHLGCVELEVSTEKTNTVARQFYRKCGFDEGGLLLEMEL